MTSVLAVVESDLDSWATVLGGYAFTAAVLAVWGARVVARNRALARQVREEDLPWR